MKKKIQKFLDALTKITNETGLWIEEGFYLDETGGFVRYNHELQKYEWFKDK